jgi:hypothetical protein
VFQYKDISMRKAAKVYEAGESVEGMKPKVVYESHKKCTPCEFGARVKQALSPESIDMNPAGGPGMGQNTALIGGQLANPTPEYSESGAYYASPAGLESRKSRNNNDRNAYTNRLLDADRDIRSNLEEEQNMNHLSAVSGLAPHIGAAVGQPLLGRAAGLAGAAMGGLGANKATRLDRPAIQKNLQEAKQNYDRVTPPNQRGVYKLPYFGKAGNMSDGSGSQMGAVLRQYPNMLRYTLPTTTLVGSLLGAGHGAIAGDGALRGALRGGLIGAGTGAGAALGGGLAVGAQYDAGLKSDSNFAELAIPMTFGGVAGGGAAGAAGGNALYNLLSGKQHTEPKPKKEKKEDKEEKSARLRNSGTMGKASAYEFGQKVAAIDWSFLKNPALGGAAAGALAGGAMGLVAPGEDEQGNRRNRFGAMLRGALGGGAIGGLGGYAMGQFAPDMPKDIYNFGRRTMTGQTQDQLDAADLVRQQAAAAAAAAEAAKVPAAAAPAPAAAAAPAAPAPVVAPAAAPVPVESEVKPVVKTTGKPAAKKKVKAPPNATDRPSYSRGFLFNR